MTTPAGSPAPDSFQPPGPEELAAMLPQYDISHLIAAGGMGAVYAGVQRALDRPVAIKILPPGAARDGESIERFRTEAKAMARLNHANIPAVYDFDVSRGYCYLVMEFIEGVTVHQLITGKELTPDATYGLITQVCEALQFAHQRGIVHGDIKPSNLLVTPDGMVKLADFGLAQLTGPGAATTETYSPMGTPEYAAPELWNPHAVMDHRADLYSLGCVFYEMLTETIPQGQFELPAARFKLDPRVDSIIIRCMQQKPALRYQSAADIRADIEALQQSAKVNPLLKSAVRVYRPPVARPGTPAATRPRRVPAKKATGFPWFWIIIAGLLGIVLILVLKIAGHLPFHAH